jgi:D-glycero-D-manno-heptose 1,7-bisphosphate phosphatase
MLLDAAERFRLDLGRSIMVGDSLCDIQAGARAGTRWLVHTLTGHGAAERPAVEAFAAGLEHSAGSSAVRYIPSIAALAPIGCDA